MEASVEDVEVYGAVAGEVERADEFEPSDVEACRVLVRVENFA